MSLRLKQAGLLIFFALASTIAVWLPVGISTIYQNFDGPYYVVVAKSWYNPEVIKSTFEFPLPAEYYAAHLPLYPLFIRVGAIIGLTHLQSMVGVTLFATVAATLLVYKIFDEFKWGNAFAAATIFLFAWPRMWAVRSVGSPETLFIFFILGSLYFFTRRKYWLSGVAGMLAVWTKSPGILLLPGYALWAYLEWRKTGKVAWKIWPVGIIGVALALLFAFYYWNTGDFWAYFNSGDNIHLQFLPFRIFDSSQAWVGTWWLEDVLWIYLLGGLGVVSAFKKNRVFASFGFVFWLSLLFVTHRDITRYSLPIVPVVILGLSSIWQKKEVQWALLIMIIPLYFYTVNFLAHNYVPISSWAPLL